MRPGEDMASLRLVAVIAGMRDMAVMAVMTTMAVIPIMAIIPIMRDMAVMAVIPIMAGMTIMRILAIRQFGGFSQYECFLGRENRRHTKLRPITNTQWAHWWPAEVGLCGFS